MRDAIDIEFSMAQLCGALRGLSGLLHASGATLDTCKAEDLGYLVGALAGVAERATTEATAAMLANDQIDEAVAKLRAVSAR